MRAKDNMRTAAEVLVDQLRIHGVRHVFCVPGESYLAVRILSLARMGVSLGVPALLFCGRCGIPSGRCTI